MTSEIERLEAELSRLAKQRAKGAFVVLGLLLASCSGAYLVPRDFQTTSFGIIFLFALAVAWAVWDSRLLEEQKKIALALAELPSAAGAGVLVDHLYRQSRSSRYGAVFKNTRLMHQVATKLMWVDDPSEHLSAQQQLRLASVLKLAVWYAGAVDEKAFGFLHEGSRLLSHPHARPGIRRMLQKLVRSQSLLPRRNEVILQLRQGSDATVLRPDQPAGIGSGTPD